MLLRMVAKASGNLGTWGGEGCLGVGRRGGEGGFMAAHPPHQPPKEVEYAGAVKAKKVHYAHKRFSGAQEITNTYTSVCRVHFNE